MSADSDNDIQSLINKSSEKRLSYLLDQVAKNQAIWILADEHGAVMFNSDDEDYIPVWPLEEVAALWCNDEWENCKPLEIKLDKWLEDWSKGLEADEVLVLSFPNLDNEGEMFDPYHFHTLIEKANG